MSVAFKREVFQVSVLSATFCSVSLHRKYLSYLFLVAYQALADVPHVKAGFDTQFWYACLPHQPSGGLRAAPRLTLNRSLSGAACISLHRVASPGFPARAARMFLLPVVAGAPYQCAQYDDARSGCRLSIAAIRHPTQIRSYSVCTLGC